MRVGDRLADVLEDAQESRQVGRGECAFPQQGGQGAALDQLHGEVGTAVAEVADLVDRRDARMLELSGDLRFLDEASDEIGVIPVPVEQDLDGEVAAQVGVAALEDGTHPAVSDLAQDLVAAGLVGHFRCGWSDHRGIGLLLGVAEQDPWAGSARLGQPGQYVADQGQVEGRLARGRGEDVSRAERRGSGYLAVRKEGGDDGRIGGEALVIFFRIRTLPVPPAKLDLDAQDLIKKPIASRLFHFGEEVLDARSRSLFPGAFRSGRRLR